jgi:hypothetical protein
MPITAADLFHDRVLPFYVALGVSVGAMLTDRGREFCGLREQNPYEILLAMEGNEHAPRRSAHGQLFLPAVANYFCRCRPGLKPAAATTRRLG